MKKNGCKAITENGKKCKRRAESGEKFCKAHLHHELPIARRAKRFFAWPAFLITILISIVAASVTTYLSGRQVEDLRKVLDSVELRQEIVDREKLKEKYPLGYVLFFADENEIHVPTENRVVKDFEIDWDNMRIETIDGKSVILISSIIYLPRMLSMRNNYVGIPRVKSRSRLPIIGLQFHVWIEVLIEKNNQRIIVLGISR